MAPLVWTRGFSRAALERAQELFGLTFPLDLFERLLDRRPVDGPDWTNEAEIRERLAWPDDGQLFDVEHNGLWWPEWGARPGTAEARAEGLRQVVAAAPRLIPVFGHRYLPETPAAAGNPVFSVWQSDVILYGADLEDWAAREDDGWDHRPWPPVREIPFWSELVRRNGQPPEGWGGG
jgi:hypothetical protein